MKNQSDLTACLISVNEADRNGEAANVVDGLFAIARALERVANSLNRLGVGDQHGMGAVEFVGAAIKEAVGDFSSMAEMSLERISKAIQSKGDNNEV